MEQEKKTEKKAKTDSNIVYAEPLPAPIDQERAQRVIFQPNPGPQTKFLAATEQEVLYGGAAGGGKSFAMLADPVRYFDNPSAKMLLLRRTTEELRELISTSKTLYPEAIPGIRWLERDKTWVAPSGASLWMSYLDNDDDVMRYQGQAYNWIGFDELTQWRTPFAWNYMRSRLRTSANTGLKLFQRATTNPGGPGHCVPFGEVLTSKGWVDIKKVVEGDEVLSLDALGKQVYKKVSGTVKEYYSGNLISRKNEMFFTENHRLPLVKDDGTLDIRPFYNLPGQCKIARAGSPVEYAGEESWFEVPPVKTRKTRKNQPDRISSRDYMELLGWFLAEGHTLDRDKEFGISQTKEPQRGEIRTLLQRCGFQFRESSSGFQVSSPKWWSYFKQFGKCRDKFIPRDVMDSPNLKTLFKSLMDGDGHWDSADSGTYYTISEQLANDVLEVCIRLGYSAKISYRTRPNRVGKSYAVSFTKRGHTELVTGNHLYQVSTQNSRVNCDKTHFEGFVYCITVPETETFFLRQNGYVWVSGNTWVKKAFIDPAPPGKSFWAVDPETGEVLAFPPGHSRAGEPLLKRRFIPANLFDNPYLAEDGMYEANLLSLPEHQRKQLLEGSWDLNEGAAFPEFNRKVHVIESFDIPDNWVKFRACDYGYGSFTAVLWFAVVPKTEQLIVYRELYVSKVTASDLAEMILEIESEDRIRYGVLDSSLWHKRGDVGPSLAEQMIKRGCRWRPSDRSAGSRIAGKNEIHRRLKVDEFTGEPGILFMDNCTQLLAQIPSLPLDKKNPEDVDTKAEDHVYDALRYGIMSRPRDRGQTYSAPKFQPVDKTFGY